MAGITQQNWQRFTPPNIDADQPQRPNRNSGFQPRSSTQNETPAPIRLTDLATLDQWADWSLNIASDTMGLSSLLKIFEFHMADQPDGHLSNELAVKLMRTINRQTESGTPYKNRALAIEVQARLLHVHRYEMFMKSCKAAVSP